MRYLKKRLFIRIVFGRSDDSREYVILAVPYLLGAPANKEVSESTIVTSGLAVLTFIVSRMNMRTANNGGVSNRTKV